MKSSGCELDVELLQVLACPLCHGALSLDAARARLACARCRMAFPVIDGLPILTAEAAESQD